MEGLYWLPFSETVFLQMSLETTFSMQTLQPSLRFAVPSAWITFLFFVACVDTFPHLKAQLKCAPLSLTFSFSIYNQLFRPLYLKGCIVINVNMPSLPLHWASLQFQKCVLFILVFSLVQNNALNLYQACAKSYVIKLH